MTTVDERVRNVQETAAFMMQFLPCPVYFTLAGHKISATLQDTAHSNGRFMLRLRIEFKNVLYDNPCAAGKAMHNSLCNEKKLDNTPPKTFDGWNKLKVCIDGQIYRLEHILPSSARKGDTVVTCLPDAPKDRRKHDLRPMLDDETESDSLDASENGHVCGPWSMVEETEPVAVRSWDQQQQQQQHFHHHHHHHHHLMETDLRPFMTTLAHHFGNHETHTIVTAVCSLPPSLLADITGSALLVRT